MPPNSSRFSTAGYLDDRQLTRGGSSIRMGRVPRKTRPILIACLVAAAGAPSSVAQPPDQRPRAHDLGLRFGDLPTGADNAITDVPGVRVGHRTVIRGDDVRTGVTAILPHGGNLFQEKVPAAIVVGNGFGKLVGSTQVHELGNLETPILLTNTLGVFRVADALIDHMLALDGNQSVRSINPVVAETNDGWLNDIRSRPIARDDVFAAIRDAHSGPVAEGSVGAGTGTRCMGFKGGIGTSSRRVKTSTSDTMLGVLVQSNFGGNLTVAGAPVGRELRRAASPGSRAPATDRGGSCVIVVATDAPLDARQLRRLAARALLGLAAVGSPMSHGSGDYVIAFSAAESVRIPHRPRAGTQRREVLRDEALTPLFQATRDATEEAIINSLLRATTVSGRAGHKSEAIPIDRLVEICKRYGAIEK